MNKLTIEERRRGLVNVKRLRMELQSVMDSKKVERGVGKCDLNSRISFVKLK
ncbi:hypothetical protein [Moritella marina]|uniref:hypothetical protein n=1 Tax=Moritella marina TaxID=90736 RepID=UPI0002FDCD41|nr:hypothetical protein [Moritella marina]